MELDNLIRLEHDVKKRLELSGKINVTLSSEGIDYKDVKKIKDYFADKGYNVELIDNATVNDTFNYSFKMNSFSFLIWREK